MNAKDLVGYIVGQVLGAIAGAGVLSVIANGLLTGYSTTASGLGQNGWGAAYLGGYSLSAAITFEFVATLLFVIVILGSTQKGAPSHMAGLAIGITLVVIHIFGINITGVSVNPARSLGPALLVGGQALAQVWLFLVVPSLAGIVAGMLYKTGALEASA
jgi:aquaporin Z